MAASCLSKHDDLFDGLVLLGAYSASDLSQTDLQVLSVDEIAGELDLVAYPHVTVGWDSNPRYNRFHDDVCLDNTPENVKKAFEYAKAYIDSHPELPVPLITVNSWNEWTETSYLHPDDLYGYGYLEAIKSVFVE